MGTLSDLVRGGLLGATTDVVGTPVDLLTMMLRPLGYKTEKPVMGSEWLSDKLGVRQTGSVPEQAARFATGLLSPGPAEFAQLGGLLGTFAGVGAKTANKAALAKAQTMAKAGADPVDVWKATGWTDQFPDGKWRFEIPDDAATVWKLPKNRMEAHRDFPTVGTVKNAINTGQNRGMLVRDVIQHPDLYQAYEHLPAKIADTLPAGSTQGNWTLYGMNLAEDLPPSQTRSTALHELQHAVQQREGFARGGSPQQFPDTAIDRQMLEDANILVRMHKSAKYGTFEEAVETFKDRFKREPNTGAISIALSGESPEAILSRKASLLDPQESYRRLAGEAEARLTQSRMNLTPAERAARPPWLEFDVPREQQIVRGLLGESVGPQMAIPKPADYRISHRPMQDAGGAARLHDLTKAFQDDVYGPNALQYYGSGDPREREILGLLGRLRGKPDAEVTIYRGVPKDAAKTINPGDWVTLSPSVAKDYGPNVVKMKVKASQVTSWPDSLLEFGYFP